MIEPIRSWFSQNQALVIFLGAQAVALGTAAAAILAYAVRLETRVSIMETRGAPHVAERLGKIDQRLSVLQGESETNTRRIERLVDAWTRDQQRRPQP